MIDVPLIWVDAGAGVAGDMLLAALLDAGADLATVQAAVDAVIPELVRLELSEVTRSGLRAARVQVHLAGIAAQHHRPWSDLRNRLGAAPLPAVVSRRALAAFGALAVAEAKVHGIAENDVLFHEVGAWDSIADVVGVSAALHDLGDPEVVVGPIALGSGTVSTAHGLLPVPVPAVLELVRGHPVVSGGEGELATPTGVALATTMASDRGPMPSMTVLHTGVGAGARDTPGRPNVLRAVLGEPAGPPAGSWSGERMTLVETTVDDLDPRVWPVLMDELLGEGAVDTWLTPVLMKKGRPGHVLTVLGRPDRAAALRRLILDRTSALGVRQWDVEREVLDRSWAAVEVPGGKVRVKVGSRAGEVVHVTPEFEDALAAARSCGRPVREVLDLATAAYWLRG